MGLFSTKYKTHASTVTTKLMDKFTNPLPGIIVSSVMANNSIAEAMNQYQVNGLYSKAMAYYRYGEIGFTRGLPSGFLRNTTIDASEIKKIIETETSSSIEILYVFYDENFYDQYTKVYLQDIRDRDYVSGVIGVNPSGISGTIYYDSYDQIDLINELRINYVDDTDAYAGSEVIPFNFSNNVAYQVLYRLLDSNLLPIEESQPIYWISIEEDEPIIEGEPLPENNPILPEDELKPTDNGNYFPIIPFYEDKEEVGSASNIAANSPLYITGKKCLKKLNINFDDLNTEIKAGTAESIGEDKGLYVYFQLGAEVTAGAAFVASADVPEDGEELPPLTSGEITDLVTRTKPHQSTLFYLYEFFLAEQENSIYDKKDFNNSYQFGLYKKQPNKNSIIITDESYQLTLSYFYITVTEKSGSFSNLNNWYSSEVWEINNELSSLRSGNSNFNSSTLIIRKEISPTTYIEIEVCGLTQEFKVFKSTSTITYLDDAFVAENPVFMTIPLNYLIVKRVPNRYRNELIHSSMCLVINSYTIQEVEWYQTGLFKAILTVISVVLAPFTGGASISLLALAFQIMTYFIVMALFNKFVLAPIFKYIAKELGPEAAAILAVVLSIAGSFKGMPYAGYLTTAGRAVFEGIDLAHKDAMEKLQKDLVKMQGEIDKLNDELDKTMGLLDTEMIIDPISMFTNRSGVVWGESTESFITSKLELPALTLAVAQTPSIYTELMVRLPSTNDTLKL